MEGEGGGKGVVRMGDESKMNGGRMRGLGVAESPCVWLDLADSMLSEEFADAKNRIITSPINMVLKIEALR